MLLSNIVGFNFQEQQEIVCIGSWDFGSSKGWCSLTRCKLSTCDYALKNPLFVSFNMFSVDHGKAWRPLSCQEIVNIRHIVRKTP